MTKLAQRNIKICIGNKHKMIISEGSLQDLSMQPIFPLKNSSFFFFSLCVGRELLDYKNYIHFDKESKLFLMSIKMLKLACKIGKLWFYSVFSLCLYNKLFPSIQALLPDMDE